MTTPPDDSDLRRLLHDAVSDVHAAHGPEAVRERAARHSPARWLPLTVAAAAAVVLVIGGTAYLAGRDDDARPAVSGPAQPSASPTAGRGRTVDVPAYYVGSTKAGPRLFRETRHVEGATDADLQVAVDEAVHGRPSDPDYAASPLPAGVEVRARADARQITLDLTGVRGPVGDLEPAAARAALQALVWTADAATRSELPVRFLQEGRPIASLLATDTSSPVARGSADSTLATVSVSSPVQGARVPTRFQVTGDAATFEANVVWELEQDGRVVRRGFTTAAQCCTLAPYSFEVSAPPGEYTLVVHDTDESDGEGVGTSEDTKDVTVAELG